MVAHRLAPRHPKADNVVLRPNWYMDARPARRDPIGLLICVGLGRWKTLVTLLASCMVQGRRVGSRNKLVPMSSNVIVQLRYGKCLGNWGNAIV